jgi:hypothetical protein
MLATLHTKVRRLETAMENCTSAPRWAARLEPFRQDPARLMSAAGIHPDPWQTAVLRSTFSRCLLLCSRQAGKSTVAAAMALQVAFLEAPALVLLLSPSLRQSGELFRKMKDQYRDLGYPIPRVGPRDNALRLELANGSRIISLPGTEETIRGYSGVSLLIIDEAARVADDLYRSVRPMLAVSGGRLVALSTPFGRRGWFFESWRGGSGWERVMVTADQCPRISREFLAEEESALGQRWFSQEYRCTFEEVVGAVFRYEDIQGTIDDELPPFFAEDPCRG